MIKFATIKVKGGKKIMKQDVTYNCLTCLNECSPNDTACPICGGKIGKFVCIQTMRGQL